MVFNDNSQNLIGVDEDPRFRIEPSKLKQILNYSFSPVSLNYGYERDESLGLYLKNCDLTKAEADSEFWIMSSRPPFSYYNDHSYSEYVSQVFDSAYQANLINQWNSLKIESKAGVDYQGNPIEYKLKTFNYHYVRIQPSLRNMAESVELAQFVNITA